ncbi:hypothetical protein HDU91_001568 [Kappamyces sp. JEL0680]|nr:hypothetical protein HDU91_001568 [Kappamyces sp. JEL0680]
MSAGPRKGPLIQDLDAKTQREIINQSGVLEKLAAEDGAPSLLEHVFISLLLTLPLMICHGFFDYIVHLQFGYEAKFTAAHLLDHQIPTIPAIFFLAFATEYFKRSQPVQVLYWAMASYIGSLVVYLAVDDQTFGGYQRTPGLITAGLLLVIQMDLVPACLSCLTVLLYYHRKLVMSYLPGGGSLNLAHGGEL